MRCGFLRAKLGNHQSFVCRIINFGFIDRTFWEKFSFQKQIRWNETFFHFIEGKCSKFTCLAFYNTPKLWSNHRKKILCDANHLSTLSDIQYFFFFLECRSSHGLFFVLVIYRWKFACLDTDCHIVSGSCNENLSFSKSLCRLCRWNAEKW